MRRSSPRMTPLLWVPAFAGMNGKGALTRTEFALVGGPRVLAQDVPELRLERGERFHQRGGIELPRDAGRSLVGGVIGKMSPICFTIQHRAAPRSCRGSIAWPGLSLGLQNSHFQLLRFIKLTLETSAIAGPTLLEPLSAVKPNKR